MKHQNIKCIIPFLIIVFITFTIPGKAQEKQTESASTKRFMTGKFKHERYDEFHTKFYFSTVEGLGFEKGVVRRDPSDIIKVGNSFYVWYTKSGPGPAFVTPEKATDELRAWPWDLSDVYYATSPDGKTWKEQGMAVGRGPKGSFDARCVFTPNILVANNRYFLYYQVGADLHECGAMGEAISMAWADSPDGPWTKAPEPILRTGPGGEWDNCNVHDPSLIVREGKYWLYYKGHPDTRIGGLDNKYGISIAWGVAIADKPEGPFVKSELNPVVIGGHETTLFPYRKGVCALPTQGPEKYCLLYAEDGLNFYPRALGVKTPQWAASVFRADNFVDTDKQDAPGITWGLYNDKYTDNEGVRWNFLMRFDCNLTTKRGDQLNGRSEKIKKQFSK